MGADDVEGSALVGGHFLMEGSPVINGGGSPSNSTVAR
jgi:hypothetical protein